MRLIDADELKERLKEYCIDGDKEAEKYYEIMGIDDCVDNAPTVDAVYGVGKYEKAMQTLREMPRCLNGIKAKQIKEIPSEVVEVVRCKDCKHMKYAIDKAKNGMCGVHSALIIMNGNDYCSYGERKEE